MKRTHVVCKLCGLPAKYPGKQLCDLHYHQKYRREHPAEYQECLRAKRDRYRPEWRREVTDKIKAHHRKMLLKYKFQLTPGVAAK